MALQPTEPSIPTSADVGPANASELGQIQRRMGRKLVAVVLFAVLVYAGLLLYGDIDAIIAGVLGIPFSAFALALLLSTGNFVVRFVRWQYYLKRLDISLPPYESALVLLAGFSMALTPVRAGELLKSLLIRETHDIPIGRTAPIIVAERVTDLVALVILSAIGCLPFRGGIALSLAGAALAALLMVVSAWRPLGEFLMALLGRFRFMERFQPKVRRAYETLWTLSGAGPFGFGLVTAVLAWGLQCQALYVVAGAVDGMHLSFTASLFIYSAPLIAGTIAMLPGGLGLTEASMTALMLQLGGPGATPASAAAITLVVRFVALWWGVGVGFGALGLWRMRFGTVARGSRVSG